MPDELIPMKPGPYGLTREDVGSFVAIDLLDGRQLVGDFQGFGETSMHVILRLPNGAVVEEPLSLVAQAYYAPMGYRPR